MSQSFEPFYDVNRTYDDNYAQGPFGRLRAGAGGSSAGGQSICNVVVRIVPRFSG